MASSGNFCTLNPLMDERSNLKNGTFSNGNLKYVASGHDGWICNMAMTGKTYCEVRIDAVSNYGGNVGFRSMSPQGHTYDTVTFQMNYSSGRIYHYQGSSDQGLSSNIGGNVSAGSIVMMAYDPATYKWWVGVNGTWRNSGDPANGSGQVFTGSSSMFTDMSAITWGGWKSSANGITVTYNFGQDSTFGGQETAGSGVDDSGFGNFKYSPPSGFLALSSGNLSVSDDIDPAQTDDDIPTKQFGAYTYTGNSGSAVTVSTDFKPDLIWVKNRSAADNHYLQDSTRGFGNSKSLSSNATGTEGYQGGAPSSSGAQNVGSSSFQAYGNDWSKSTNNFIAWCWRANGGVTSSNTDGDVTSTVQANTKAGFSIVQYVGNRSSAGTSTCGHGLGGVPDMFITKPTSHSGRWYVWHTGMSGASYMLELNSLNAQQDKSANGSMSLPTSTVFDITYTEGLGENGETHIGYFWRSIEGFSKFGKYEGSGGTNSNTPFIYTGFRPRLLFIKDIDAGNEWYVQDTARETDNPTENFLEWNTTDAEQSKKLDIYSNGFKPREDSARFNDSHTYIYGAWADVPFKYNNTF